MTKHSTSRRHFTAVASATAALAFVGGFGLARATSAQTESAPPAYLLVSSKVLDPDAMRPYRAAAGPLAAAAGLEIVAGRPDPTVTVLEGEWPYEEGLVIEKFSSMAALKSFGTPRAIKTRRSSARAP